MIFYKNILNKMNGETYLKKSTTIAIKIWREYLLHLRFFKIVNDNIHIFIIFEEFFIGHVISL
jgi:hypothetical protein